MTRTSRTPLDALRRRFRLLQVGLFLPVLMTGVLAFGYFNALKFQRRAVDVAGRQIARRVADQSLAEASRLGDSAARTILGPVLRAQPPTPERIFAAMQRATDSLRRCRCGPLKEGAYFFYWVPASGAFATSVPVPPEHDPRRRVPLPIPDAVPGQLIWASAGRDSTGPWLLHNTAIALANGDTAIVGFDISMSSWWTGTLLPGLETTRRRFFPMLADSQQAFSARLMMGEADLAHTGEPYDGPRIRIPLGSVAIYSLGLELNPAILPVLISSATAPSYPVLIGAIAGSLLFSLLAVLFLRQLRLTLTRREAFVASITHELRTPLTEVLLHAESLHLDRQTPETKSRAAASIVRETRRVIALVENALTMSGAGRVAGPPPPIIHPAPFLRESLRSLELAVVQRGARLEVNLDEQATCAIDPVSLDRITVNLVENGLRYGPDGQTITVGLRCEDHTVQLTVDDHGPGVHPSERSRIWDPFERGSAAKGHAAAGVGVGLAVVKYLAEMAGGRVAVSEAPSGGARFVVSLPMQTASL